MGVQKTQHVYTIQCMRGLGLACKWLHRLLRLHQGVRDKKHEPWLWNIIHLNLCKILISFSPSGRLFGGTLFCLANHCGLGLVGVGGGGVQWDFPSAFAQHSLSCMVIILRGIISQLIYSRQLKHTNVRIHLPLTPISKSTSTKVCHLMLWNYLKGRFLKRLKADLKMYEPLNIKTQSWVHSANANPQIS